MVAIRAVVGNEDVNMSHRAPNHHARQAGHWMAKEFLELFAVKKWKNKIISAIDIGQSGLFKAPRKTEVFVNTVSNNSVLQGAFIGDSKKKRHLSDAFYFQIFFTNSNKTKL